MVIRLSTTDCWSLFLPKPLRSFSLYTSDCYSKVSNSKASRPAASPEHSLEMQMLELHPKYTESETLKNDIQKSVF